MAKQRPKKQGARKAMKKYPGVYVRDTPRGRAFDIAFRRGGKLLWERIGYESDGFSPDLASTIRGNRIQDLRYGKELPQDLKRVSTFGKVWKEYLEWAKKHKKTWRTDEIRYNLHLEPRFANMAVDLITPKDIEKLKSDLAKDGKAPATIKLVLALFRGIFNRGREAGLIACENPAARCKMPDVDNARERFLNTDECALLLGALAGEYPLEHELAVLALNTGARFGDIAQLTWKDVNLKARAIVFRGTKNKLTRRVPMNDAVYDVLINKEAGPPSQCVFLRPDGKPCKQVPQSFRNVANELFNKGLPRDDRRHRVTFHTLRHTAASHMVMAGVPLLTVGRILGQLTPAMTNRYAHLAPEAQRAAVDTLGKALHPVRATPRNKRGASK